jgi:hypothetical protein
VVVLGTTEASGRYSGADLRLRKGDEAIDSNSMQVYVNVKVMNDTGHQARVDPCGSGLARECDHSGNDGGPADAFAGKPAPTGVGGESMSYGVTQFQEQEGAPACITPP